MIGQIINISSFSFICSFRLHSLLPRAPHSSLHHPFQPLPPLPRGKYGLHRQALTFPRPCRCYPRRQSTAAAATKVDAHHNVRVGPLH